MFAWKGLGRRQRVWLRACASVFPSSPLPLAYAGRTLHGLLWVRGCLAPSDITLLLQATLLFTTPRKVPRADPFPRLHGCSLAKSCSSISPAVWYPSNFLSNIYGFSIGLRHTGGAGRAQLLHSCVFSVGLQQGFAEGIALISTFAHCCLLHTFERAVCTWASGLQRSTFPALSALSLFVQSSIQQRVSHK